MEIKRTCAWLIGATSEVFLWETYEGVENGADAAGNWETFSKN